MVPSRGHRYRNRPTSIFPEYPNGEKTVPRTLSRPGAFIAAGAAASPAIADALASGAGVGGCVRAQGVVGFLAAHGALMRGVPSCPSATVGLPEVVDSAMAFLLAVAIITSLVH